MKAKEKKNYYYIGIALAAIAVGWLVFGGSLQAASGNFEDSGLAANIRFTDDITGNDIPGTPKADALDPLANLGTFSVFTAEGKDVSNANITIGMKGKILASGVPVSHWAITGNLTVLVDGKLFKSYALANSGGKLTDNVVIIKLGGNNERAIKISNLKNFWGAYNYGNHRVSLIASATLTVDFEDGTHKTKQVNTANVGSVTLTNKSDATVSGFEVGSQVGT